MSPVSSKSPVGDDSTLCGRVLLAEDHPVNQDVELHMLRLLGLEVTVAEDGRKALDALSTGDYDAVLMDCDMPNMDGYQATGEIRRREQAQGAGRVPVIALTANALQGDREKCLRAGMDDYIAKPLKTEELRAILQHWLPEPGSDDSQGHEDRPSGPRPDEHSVSEAGVADEPPALDGEVLAGILAMDADGTSGFLAQLAQKYADSWVRDFQALETEIQGGDAEAARKLAHRLKSSSANLGALGLAALCQELESALRAGRLDGHEELLARMTGEHQRARTALTLESRRVA